MRHIEYHERLKQLDQFLVASRHLWQPHPFVTERPAWCESQPELTRTLLDLDKATLTHYASDNEALVSFLAAFLPELGVIPSFTVLPATKQHDQHATEPRFSAGIPGRKWQQITALHRCIEKPQQAITEWCGGKGYLGRLLSEAWQHQVTTLEYDRELVEAGRALADKLNVNQQFKRVDVLTDQADTYLSNRHTIALHACGDLHRELIHKIIRTNTPGFTLVPCCYHLGRDKAYTPFNRDLTLNLSREALRLAVNETVTAHHNEIKKRNQDMAWKLGFQLLRAELAGSSDYHSFRPVPTAWLQEGFQSYCRKLCEREQLMLPHEVDWHGLESRAYKRQSEVMRLQLLRHCFRRAVELWLIMDMATFLESHGYTVNVSMFCSRSLTPRNIMIEGLL